MNKLMGFFELQDSNLPTIPWKEFDENTILDNSRLWTIRTAVLKGNDLNLPRSVGKDAEASYEFAKAMLKKFGKKGMVIYYPYFVTFKSGTLNVYKDRIIIEAVKDDLWNLVTNSDREVTIRIEKEKIITYGNDKFITENELAELLSQIPKIRSMFRSYLIEGKSILLEWSYAYSCDLEKNPIGNQYLVFYEARTV